jgi:hypothetical protein
VSGLPEIVQHLGSAGSDATPNTPTTQTPPDPPSAEGGIIGKTFGPLTVIATDAMQKRATSAALRRFDQGFAALQAELSPVEANAYDAQKRRSYADLNALVEAVGPLAASKGFGLTYDAGPGSDNQQGSFKSAWR